MQARCDIAPSSSRELDSKGSEISEALHVNDEAEAKRKS